MRQVRLHIAWALCAACVLLGARLWAGDKALAQARWRLDLSVSPLLGVDRPLRGGSCSVLAGSAIDPFELGLRAGCAYEPEPDLWGLRADCVVGLGSGLRAIIGGLVLFGELELPGSDGARAAAGLSDWPNRFGIGARLFELPWRRFAASLGLEAELVYCAYRILGSSPGSRPSALSGAAAFAASVEASISLRLRWETRARP